MIIIQRLVLSLIFTLILYSSALCQSDENICFEGKIEKMAPETFLSGFFDAYRLVRYQVIKVTKGEYSKKYIVVDHLILTGKELDNVYPGDIACVCVKKTNNIGQRWDVKGIRESNEIIEWYYIAKSFKKGRFNNNH